MAALDRDELLGTVHDWLPAENILTDAQILSLMEGIILIVGDDEIYKSEVACKTLVSCGEMNKTLGSISAGRIKREKSFEREVEYNSVGVFVWDDFINGLSYLCPLLPGGGYSLASKNSYGFYGNIADTIYVPSCPDLVLNADGTTTCYDCDDDGLLL
jgi:hypothetical protein